MKGLSIQFCYNCSLIVLFILLLFAPAISMLVSEKSTYSLTERRLLTNFPKLPKKLSDVQIFFSGIDQYFNDHFGFRDRFIYRYQREVRKHFNIVGADTTVHQGLDNWFYLGKFGMLKDFTGNASLSSERLGQWMNNHRGKRSWLSARGIKYLLIISPNKQSVYPEYMMKDWQQVQGTSRLQQLVAAYPTLAETAMVDLASSLRGQKDEEPLYFQSDTHWTHNGAYLAYLSIAERLESLVPDIKFRTDFSFNSPAIRRCEPSKDKCGDLTNMLLDFPPFTESLRTLKKDYSCVVKEPLPYDLSNIPQLTSTPSFSTKCQEKNLRAVVFHDSFFITLEPYFSENFKEVVYLYKAYDQQNILELLDFFHPDIVIEEVVERNLFNNM